MSEVIDLCHVTATNFEINIQTTHKLSFSYSDFIAPASAESLRDGGIKRKISKQW